MKTILFLLLFLPFLSFSQSQLDVFGSADLTNCNYGWDSFSGSVRNSKKARFNTHFGVNYYQNIKEVLWFKVGLGFVSTGFREDGVSELRYGSQHDGQGGFNPNAPAQEISWKTNHHFLEVPIGLRLDFSGKKITPFLEFGISTMYYLQTVSVREGFNEPRSVDRFRANSINQIQFAPVFALGANYKLNEKWSVYAQPNFHYHLTKMAKEPSIGVHQWGIGVGVGARMNLK